MFFSEAVPVVYFEERTWATSPPSSGSWSCSFWPPLPPRYLRTWPIWTRFGMRFRLISSGEFLKHCLARSQFSVWSSDYCELLVSDRVSSLTCNVTFISMNAHVGFPPHFIRDIPFAGRLSSCALLHLKLQTLQVILKHPLVVAAISASAAYLSGDYLGFLRFYKDTSVLEVFSFVDGTLRRHSIGATGVLCLGALYKLQGILRARKGL